MLAAPVPSARRARLRRALAGVLVAVATIAVLTAVMVPLRASLAVATSALVLVVPVVLAVVAGGISAGVVAVALGFLAYDFFFIPPYGTLNVGATQNWVALGVYAAVMLVVTQVVERLHAARREITARAAATRRLLALSDLLIADKPQGELLSSIVATVQAAFGFSAVALLLVGAGGEGRADSPAAAAGETLTPAELAAAMPSGGAVSSLVSAPARPGGAAEDWLLTVPLVATGRPLGALVARGHRLDPEGREFLHVYATQAALAVERAALHEQALRTELLEQADRWRSALVGAVSHDLRTPLASVKAAVSDLRRSDVPLSDANRDELLALVEMQSDRLARLVTNLLDMTRIQSGALVARRGVLSVDELVDEALAMLTGSGIEGRVLRRLDPELPPVDGDHALLAEALANLVENAMLHAPDAGTVEIGARRDADRVEISVTDHGPGIAPEERERIFLMFNRVGGGGRAGLGLAIVKAFLEAHGEAVRVADAPGGGATFSFALPVARVRTLPPDEGASRRDDLAGQPGEA